MWSCAGEMDVDENLDPGGLIRESYRIEGIGIVEARSIFLDWAIKLAPELDAQVAVRRLLALYGGLASVDHPMTKVLEEGLGATSGPARRRGGSRGNGGTRRGD